MWHYLYFIVLVRVKNPTEFTGPESYVSKMIQERNLEWFPRMRALSLDSYLNDLNDDSSGNYDQIKILQTNLELTQQLVATLSHQLSDLREQVKYHLVSYVTAHIMDSYFMPSSSFLYVFSSVLSHAQMTEQRKHQQRKGILSQSPAIFSAASTPLSPTRETSFSQ